MSYSHSSSPLFIPHNAFEHDGQLAKTEPTNKSLDISAFAAKSGKTGTDAAAEAAAQATAKPPSTPPSTAIVTEAATTAPSSEEESEDPSDDTSDTSATPSVTADPTSNLNTPINTQIITEIESSDQTDLKFTINHEEGNTSDSYPIPLAVQIINAYAKKNKCNDKLAMAGITKLIQDGGTNTSKPPFSRTIDGISFDLTSLRQTIKLYDAKGTVRKLGKSIAYSCLLIARANQWPGPLYNELVRISSPSNPLKSGDAYACCEIYIKIYNFEMPAYIRELLILREAKLRESRMATQIKTGPPGPGKKNNKRGK